MKERASVQGERERYSKERGTDRQQESNPRERKRKAIKVREREKANKE